MSDETKREMVLMDVELRHDVDEDDVYRALVALGDDALALPTAYRDKPDDLDRRMVGWGYALRHPCGGGIGVHGDFVIAEEDDRFWPAMAPFVHPYSRIVFTDDHGATYGGWSFKDGVAHKRKAERSVEYGWVE